MSATAKVSVVRTDVREDGIRSAIELLGNKRPPFANQNIVLKPNFNSADPFPAGTHNDTLAALIRLLQEDTPASITVAERSGGSWKSHEVADTKGVRPIFEELDVDYIVLDDLSAEDWALIALEDNHWERGIEVPRLVLDDAIFEQEQIARAVQLGLGIGEPTDMELIGAPDHESQRWLYLILKQLSG